MTPPQYSKRYGEILRVSSMDGRQESADSTMTLTDQHKRAVSVAARHNGQVTQTFNAANVSGWISTNSPQYRAAMTAIRTGELDGLVFGYFNRQARNNWTQMAMFAELEALRADCWFADHPDVDYRTREGRMLFGILGTVNQDVLLEARDKGNAFAQEVILERGVSNQDVFGYQRNALRQGRRRFAPKQRPDLDARAFVPDPDEAPVVRLIFELRADGTSWTAISERTGLSVSTVRSIVRNEVYLGTVQYRRRLGHRRGPSSGETLRKENAHEPLVSRALWKRAQSATTIQRTGTYAAGVAGGLVTCSGCGKKLAVSGSLPHLTYSCRRQARKPGRCAAPVHVIKTAVDDRVDQLVAATLHDRINTAPDTALGQLHAEVANAHAELNQFQAVADSLGGDPADFAVGFKVRRERLTAARTALEQMQDRVEVTEDLPTPEAYLRLPVAARRRVATELLADVTILPVNGGKPADRVDPTWR